MTSTRTILSHARDSPPQHSTTVMAPLAPGVAYRRPPPRKPEFPMFPPPGRAKLPLSRKPSRRLSIFPRPCRVPAHDQTLPAAHRHPEPPGETTATELLNWLKEQPCDSWAIGNLGSSSRGIQPIPARSRRWRGLHSESPGIGAEPARVPEPVGTSLREAGHIFGGCHHNTVCLPEVCEIGGLGIQVFRKAQLPSVAGFGNVR